MITISTIYSLTGKNLDIVKRYTGGKDILHQVGLYCYCRNISHANRICRSYKLEKDIFTEQNSRNEKDEEIIKLAKRYQVIFQIPDSGEFVPIQILQKEVIAKISRPGRL